MNDKLNLTIREKAQEFLKSKLGTPYLLGAKDFNPSIDCSGLVRATFKAVGFNIPDGSCNQYDNSTPIEKEDIDTMDLAFFTMNGKVNHIAIVFDDIVLMEASGSKGGVVETLIDDFMLGRTTHSGKSEFAGFRRANCFI